MSFSRGRESRLKERRILDLPPGGILHKNITASSNASDVSKKNTLFIFLRHFGCPACRSHALQVWQNRAQIESKNCQIVFIGNGTKEMIQDFKSILNDSTVQVYTDPTMQSYYAIGFKRGFVNVIKPASAKNLMKAMTKGVPSGDMTGYKWQLGGVIFIKTTGEVLYLFFSEAIGDYPAEEEVRDVPWVS